MNKCIILILLENIYCKCCSLCQDSEKLIKNIEQCDKNIEEYFKDAEEHDKNFIELSKKDCDKNIKICEEYLNLDQRFEILKKEYVNIKKKLVLPSYNGMSKKEKIESIIKVNNNFKKILDDMAILNGKVENLLKELGLQVDEEK